MQLYDPAAVSEILGVTVVTLCHWRKAGVGPEWFMRGRYCYYRAEQLQAYIEQVGPIPADMSPSEKKRFFTDAHRPDVVPGPPEQTGTVAELAERLAVVEKALAKLKRRKRTRQWLEIGRSKGYGPPFTKVEGFVRYKRAEVDCWMLGHQRNALKAED